MKSRQRELTVCGLEHGARSYVPFDSKPSAQNTNDLKGRKNMCGVFGVCGYAQAAESCHNGLYQLQHRGQTACGIATSRGKMIRVRKGAGYVKEAFTPRVMEQMPGHIAIGHTRYPTTGDSHLNNTQPHLVDDIPLAFCSNGDITPSSYQKLRFDLEKDGVRFDGDNDGELLAKYIAHRLIIGDDLSAAIGSLMENAIGSYSALLLLNGKMVAFRDPLGIRPLVMGKRDNTWLVASETCALEIVRARDDIREIAPGEVVIFEPGRPPQSFYATKRPSCRHCVFELIYFAMPDSVMFGISVYQFRETLGRILAGYYAILAGRDGLKVDLVIPVPDSSNAAAVSFAATTRIPHKHGLTRSHYTGRTFIEPGQSRREDGVREKFNPVRAILREQRVAVIDDSIVRGTTSKKIVRMLRNAGVAAVHLFIASPPIIAACFYGIDMKTTEEMIAARKTVKEITVATAADSLTYLQIADLEEAVRQNGGNPCNFCYACFGGEYPTTL